MYRTGDNDNENEIDKEFDEARERKIKNIIITRKGDDVMEELCDKIKDDIKVQSEANLFEPFEEFVKQVGVKPFEYISTEVKNEKNADVID